jgi:hypothetical protein
MWLQSSSQMLDKLYSNVLNIVGRFRPSLTFVGRHRNVLFESYPILGFIKVAIGFLTIVKQSEACAMNLLVCQLAK